VPRRQRDDRHAAPDPRAGAALADPGPARPGGPALWARDAAPARQRGRAGGTPHVARRPRRDRAAAAPRGPRPSPDADAAGAGGAGLPAAVEAALAKRGRGGVPEMWDGGSARVVAEISARALSPA